MTPTRAGLLTGMIILLGLALRRPTWVRDRWAAFWRGQSAPIDLALFRILTFSCLLFMIPRPEIFLDQPRGLMALPFGWKWIGPNFPLNELLTTASRLAVVIGSVFGLLGLFTRTASFISLLGALYAFGVFQIWGKVTHFHHFIWFLSILSVAPSGDALALDALRRRRSPSRPDPLTPSRVHGLPLRFVWMLLGVIYLFPGLWKLWSCGISWCSADAMRALLHSRWDEIPFFSPLFRIDRYPALLTLGGSLVLIFEVGFSVALFFPRLRTLFLFGGVLFHLSNWKFLLILFWIIPIFYLSFVPWHRIVSILRPAQSISTYPTTSSRGERGMLALGTALLVLNGLAGAFRVNSWPFACYPTFAYRASSAKLTLEIELEFDGRPSEVLDLRPYFGYLGADRWDRELQSLATATQPKAVEARLRAVWTQIGQVDPSLRKSVRRIHFIRGERATDPDLRLHPLTRREPFHSLDP